MPNLFAYGTLMCDDIMQEVAGCLPRKLAGVLAEYRRTRIHGAQYPGIAPDAQQRVTGVIYLDLPQQAWQRLDDFEGPMYARQTVAITCPDQSPLDAETYVVRPKFRHLLLDAEWDFDRFLQKGKSAFLSSYAGFNEL